MAHELTITQQGFAEMAYVGETPWHGLGQLLLPDAGIDQWRIAAGMDWQINRTAVQYTNGQLHSWPDNEVLYRSDTNAPLAVVSSKYKVVQPASVLEFFRDLVAEHGFSLETAGTMKGGRRFWALARTGLDDEVVPQDPLKTYLLLVTSCDGGLATTAQFTSIRVVCNNTLQMSFRNSKNRVSVRHNTTFDPRDVKHSLGLDAQEVFGDFMTRMKTLANRSLTGKEAEDIIEALFVRKGVTVPVRSSKGFQTVMQLFNGAGKGSRLDGVAGTAWGVVNAVTEYTDHHIRARNAENRLDSAWFGVGANLKESILQIAESY